jgi:outer membrane lipoprotein-sorting protein
MKRFIISLLLVLLASANILFAQDKKAEAILAGSRTKVKSLVNMVASFNKTLELRGSSKKPVFIKGKIKMKKEKFRVELSDQLVICNGKKMWSYLIEDKECTESDYDPNDGFSPDRIFSITQSNMKTKYDGIQTVNGAKAEKITMLANEKRSEYFKVETWIDASKLLPVQVKIWNRNGSVVTFQITNVDTNTQLADTEFTFNPKDYPGIEVIRNQK